MHNPARILPLSSGNKGTRQGHTSSISKQGVALEGELTLMAETYLWGLQGICQLQRIPFTPHLVQQQFPPPYSLTSLQQAATALGLKSGLRDALAAEDRKSTRLNSSHSSISYA